MKHKLHKQKPHVADIDKITDYIKILFRTWESFCIKATLITEDE